MPPQSYAEPEMHVIARSRRRWRRGNLPVRSKTLAYIGKGLPQEIATALVGLAMTVVFGSWLRNRKICQIKNVIPITQDDMIFPLSHRDNFLPEVIGAHFSFEIKFYLIHADIAAGIDSGIIFQLSVTGHHKVD